MKIKKYKKGGYIPPLTASDLVEEFKESARRYAEREEKERQREGKLRIIGGVIVLTAMILLLIYSMMNGLQQA